MVEPARGIELSDGDEFAGYRIERRLGRGGMGILYLAVEPGLERRVALKLIAPEATSDEVFARRFAEESRIAASIEHPNVVPIYAAGEEAGVPYIAMRYVAGADLARRLVREGRLPPQIAVGLIAQIGNGLDAIHAAGLIHRDVKPANVLLSGDDHAYITDFGVARNVATESGLTQTGRFVGTLDYVAPEQISGGAIDARVDVYALGCLLFKLLTGEVPFPKDGEAARLYAHLNDPPPAPSLYVPEVSMALDDVVIRAMSKDPDDRHPSAGDLGRAAQAALRGERPAAPERTVATGAAATRTAETISTRAGEARVSTGATEPTRRLDGEEPPAATERKGSESAKRRWAMIGGVAALLVAFALAVILLSGGGGSGSGTTGTTASEAANASKQAPKRKPKPKTLTKSELIVKADAICESSQSTYKDVRSQALEEAPDVSYAATLAGISQRGTDRFRRLNAPPSVEPAFRKYVQAQERVMRYDRQALDAAEVEDTTAYLAARARRDAEAGERYDLAREIGLEQCSTSR
jgi:hypothetical protein